MMYGHPLLTSVDSCLQWAQQTKKAQGLSRLCPENLVYTSIQDRKYHKKKKIKKPAVSNYKTAYHHVVMHSIYSPEIINKCNL